MRPGPLLLLLAVAPMLASSLRADDRVSVFLELTEPSLAEVRLDAQAGRGPRLAEPRATAARRRAELQAGQARLSPALQSLEAQVTGRFVGIMNALRVKAPAHRLADLARLPGVRQVRLAHRFKPLRSSSVPWIGAPAVWARPLGNGTTPPTVTGSGIRIGIIDSGIDYLHADFGGPGRAGDFATNNPTRIEPNTFPTAKVVGGWDFVGDRYNAADLFNSIPEPDPDPLDPAANGHGTHVAGIAAGFGVLKDGTPYRGRYEGLDPSDFSLGPGVAPEALLYALKVFGASGFTDAVLDALDWAADPDSDGDVSDRLDILVLALGDTFGVDDPANLELKAIERLSRLGTVVCIAAGNDGDTSYIVGNPGVAPRAITAANSIDGGAGDPAVQVLQPEALAGFYAMEEGAFTPALATHGPVEGELIETDPADACDTLANAPALAGRIALIRRGTCFFVEKIRAAQSAGATAVVVDNNVDSPARIIMSANGDFGDIRIPAVMVSRADGRRLREFASTGTVRMRLADGLVQVHAEEADRLESTSSRGPVLGSHRLKPDLAAPGSRIASARAGSGAGGIVYSGTSMAIPHVGGAAALLRQMHPDWPAEDIKAALMNTASPTRDDLGQPCAESLTGAGRIDLEAAARTLTTVRADNDSGEVSVSLGIVDVPAGPARRYPVRITHRGGSPVTLRLGASSAHPVAGVILRPIPDRLTVMPFDTATFEVALEIDPARLETPPRRNNLQPPVGAAFPRHHLPEAGGVITVEGDGISLRLPWHAILRPTANQSVTRSNLGIPPTTQAAVALATRGPTAHPRPLVALFQLGSVDTDHAFGDSRAATDVVAVGAASDFQNSGSISNTTLYFGMATSGPWSTPQRAVNSFDVQIDLDTDGVPDFTVLNTSAGAFEEGDAEVREGSDDRFITAVREEDTGDLLAEWPLNLLDPGEADTAPFANAALVHAVQASDIGLTERRTTFRYRIETDGEYSDRTPWVAFNAARPAVDATPYGIQGTPFFDEGRGLEFDLDRAAAGGAVPPRILLLHLHHAPGRQHEMLTLNPAGPDADADGLPDDWEIRNFGDLDSGATEDPDADGLNNAEELANGTAPDEVRILPPARPGNTLRWASRAGRWFTIESSDRLQGPYRAVRSHVPAVNGTNTFLDPEAAPALGVPRFYRLRSE